jgi:hypothetical protein
VSRREYDISITFNGIGINKVIIDPHYELKHSESINDELILELVKKLDGADIAEDSVDGPYTYFVDDLEYRGKLYRLVWLLEDHQIYIGVVNAHRR